MTPNPFAHWQDAKSVCVIGAGTMGSGIAAHLANLGFQVTLLDRDMPSAVEAFDRARVAKPPHFYTPDTPDRIRLGGIDQHLDWAGEADWVCEAVFENLDIKRALFAQLEHILQPDAMISTNTSGLEIAHLAQGRSRGFRSRFVGTHFFNPPRYLKLLELIPTPDTDPLAVESITTFLESRVARRVVLAKDTPGFIANRYGMWCMYHAIHVAERLRLTVEQVDAITGPFLGRPRSGSFRLADIVGLDIMQDIAKNLLNRCVSDPQNGTLNPPVSLATLLERGWIGEKAGQGYTRRDGRQFLSLDLQNLAYRERFEADLPSLRALGKLPFPDRLRQAMEAKDEVGEYLRAYLIPALRYAESLKEEISHNVQDFDRVMQWGFGWEVGPFGMIDILGPQVTSVSSGPFYQDGKVRGFDGSFAVVKPEPAYRALTDFPVVKELEGFRVRDLGDGVHGIALTSKMGVLSPPLVADLLTFLESGPVNRFVLSSEARCFSAGFNLEFFLQRIEEADFSGIESALVSLQQLSLRLGQFPSVAAVFGYCLGGGLELALGCTRIAAHPETTIGFPEARVGLLPAGAGSARMRLGAQSGGAKRIAELGMLLTRGEPTPNPDLARREGVLRATDQTIYHPDRLFTAARELVLSLAPEPLPAWQAVEGPIGGMMDRLQQEAKARGEMTDHDELIGDAIKQVLARSTSFEDALARERERFLVLCGKALSVARIRHMLETGKPLRN